jgi:hypothetical protein
MILIGLTGRAGCGKDTVGEILKEKHGFGTTSIAYPIKKIIASLFGESVDKWNDREWREETQLIWGQSPRQLAQTLGTEWGRHTVRPSIWIDLTLTGINVAGWNRVAITDVRFQNEAIAVTDLGGYIVHVYRDDTEAGTKHTSHSSEGGVDATPYSLHIYNSGSMKALEQQVDQAVTQILWHKTEVWHEEVQSNIDDPARASA